MDNLPNVLIMVPQLSKAGENAENSRTQPVKCASHTHSQVWFSCLNQYENGKATNLLEQRLQGSAGFKTVTEVVSADVTA
jgi:hypothetical protein